MKNLLLQWEHLLRWEKFLILRSHNCQEEKQIRGRLLTWVHAWSSCFHTSLLVSRFGFSYLIVMWKANLLWLDSFRIFRTTQFFMLYSEGCIKKTELCILSDWIGTHLYPRRNLNRPAKRLNLSLQGQLLLEIYRSDQGISFLANNYYNN